MRLFSSLLLALPLLVTTALAEKVEKKPVAVIHLNAIQASKMVIGPNVEKRPTVIDIRTLGEFKEDTLQPQFTSTFWKRLLRTQFKS